MDYYDYYDYGFENSVAQSAVEGVAGFMLVFVLAFYLLLFAYCITAYVLQAIGTYTIAKRRGIHHAWLAWVPVGSDWVLGSISDQYQYIVKGRVRNRRKVLVGLSIGLLASLVVLFAGVFVAALSEALGTVENDMLFGSAFAVSLLGYLAMGVLAVILLVFQYIALYDLYASCEPGNAVLYLVLSICFSVAMPFFVFACRRKDLGMPPRRTAEPVQPILPPEPAAEAEVEPAAEEPAEPAAEEEPTEE